MHDTPGERWLLCPDGDLDGPDHPLFPAVLRAAAREGLRAEVIVDLSRVLVVTAAGLRGLVDCVRTLREGGGTLLLAAATDAVAPVLRLALVGGGVRFFATVEEAVAARSRPSGRGAEPETRPGTGPEADPEVVRLRQEVAHLRGKLRSHPLIAQAEGILQERYRLPTPQSAFTLLRQSSQTHNVKLRTLAAALLRLPRPDRGSPLWFPGRTRHPAPALPLLSGEQDGGANRGAVMKRLLHRALDVVDTDMGDLQSADPVGGLRLEYHHGFGRDFVDFFAHVGEGETTCALAAADARLVTADAATDRVFSDTAREVILATGCRTIHSIPMTDASRRVVGVFSVHLTKAGRGLTRGETRILTHLAAQGGAWLDWHERTVVLDALEHLHGQAIRVHETSSPGYSTEV